MGQRNEPMEVALSIAWPQVSCGVSVMCEDQKRLTDAFSEAGLAFSGAAAVLRYTHSADPRRATGGWRPGPDFLEALTKARQACTKFETARWTLQKHRKDHNC
jgi:hypothetical protein